MKSKYQKFISAGTAFTLSMSMFLTPTKNVSAKEANSSSSEGTYEIYPSPQKIEYTGGNYILDETINVVYENGIDEPTKKRLQEIADLKKIEITESKEVKEGATNVLVGTVDNEDKTVDDYFTKNNEKLDQSLFEKTDSYVLESKNNTIAVLGKDNDSSFYGLTTLYHIIKQIDSYTISNFYIEDYADIVSRGFIEGYYGEPWSTEDRINLMTWGGYYKLNSYFYAPKDDPKHNKDWRGLYTDDEINQKIKPLAEAGNNSKTRFVYALHPFMNSPMTKPSDNEEQYQKDLETLKAKFKQVIDAGVRQIAILADDAAHWGNENYIRLLEDMTSWLKELQKQEQFKDLKTILPFCTQEYMRNGEEYYKQFPKEVQIVMTGGKVWGEVTDQFTTAFKKNAGRGPYMWINWPCTDNSKKHLIMGGYSNFLHPGVSPDNIQGIVLNPMQQSEPSKVAIFGNACYSWNIWQDKDEADKAWNASFKYVDHNSAVENEASSALRELSKHMINQAMDSRVVALDESVELKLVLDDFKEKLKSGEFTEEDIAKIEAEFTKLKEATEVFDKQAGDKNLRKQMDPWIECWKETTDAVLKYTKGLKAFKEGNTTAMVNAYSEGNKAFNTSKTHGFNYVDHKEYAEVGVQHIVPFIKELDSFLAKKVIETSDPSVLTKTYISNRFVKPSSGSTESVFDENDGTSMVFKDPSEVKKDDYFGVEFNRPIDITSIRIASGDGKNHFFKSKLQYKADGSDEWLDVSDEVYSRPQNSKEDITAYDLNLKNAKAVRLLATEDNGVDCWLEIKSIDINKAVDGGSYRIDPSNISLQNVQVAGGKLDSIVDGKNDTEVYLFKGGNGSDKDTTPAGASVTLDLGSNVDIGSVYLAQGASQANDVLSKGVVEYKVDKGENATSENDEWIELGKIDSSKEQTVYSNEEVKARYIRVRNTEDKNVWWRLGEISVYSQKATKLSMQVKGVGLDIAKNPSINDNAKNNKLEYIVDGKKDTMAWMQSSAANGNIRKGNGVEISFNKPTSIKDIKITQGSNDSMPNLEVKYKNNESEWVSLKSLDNCGAEVVVDGNNINTTAIQILSTADRDTWWQLVDVEVTESPKASAENVISNVENNNFKASVEKAKSTLTSGKATLKANDYVGVDLKEIRDIENIEVKDEAVLKNSHLTLQISKNNKVWEDVNAGELNGKKARYVRLINKTNKEINLNLESMTVNTLVIGNMGELISSDIKAVDGWGDSRNNGSAFDGDMNTKTKFGGQPMKDNSIVYSFGQKIDVKSLRFYVSDNEADFLRDAEIYLSEDGKNWGDAVFTVGDNKTDNDPDTTVINREGYEPDSKYPNVRYVGKDGINKQAKYLKIKINVDYPERAIVINEIQVNGGAYVSPEDNQAFSGTIETRGNRPSNMLDQNIVTVYEGSQENGSITYNLSESDGINSFRFVQIGKATGTTVEAELFDKNATGKNQVSNLVVGTLNQGINEFNIPEGKELLSVKVSWGKEIPKIAEFITLSNKQEAVDKTRLEELIKSTPEGFENWTKSSKENYNDVIEVAKSVNSSEYVSKATVDSAIKGIEQAIKDAEIKANIEPLRKVLDEKIANNNTYTLVTYSAYESALNKVESALQNADDISEKQAQKLLSMVEEAKNALQYSIRNREVAEVAIRSYDASVSANYTKQSMTNWTNAYNTLKDLIEKDKASSNNEGRVKPEELLKATDNYKKAMNDLVSIVDLKALIDEFEKTSDKGYTEESFNAYKSAVESSYKLLENGTKEQVAEAISAIKNAKAQLKVSDKYLEDVANRIESMKGEYTSESYNKFKDAFEKVKSAKPEDGNFNKLIEELKDAENNLVSITGLKAIVEQFNTAPQKDNWTRSYANKVNELLERANEFFNNGTKEQIDEISNELQELYKVQVVRADGVKEYQDSIVKKDASAYTEESYAEYEKAYDALMALDPEDVTEEEFLAAKEAYELAEANLELVGTENQGNADNDKNSADGNVKTGDSNEVATLLVIVLATGLLGYVGMRKRTVK